MSEWLHHPDRLRWNEKFLRRGMNAFGQEPAAWLVEHEDLLRRQPGGLVLDLACGAGRNAFYLAQLGFTVEAVDLSDVALAWLAEQARQRGARILPVVMNLAEAALPSARYQVIINFNYLERRLHHQIKQALQPGGLLLFETMTTDQLALAGGKFNPEFLLQPNELLHAFSDLRILHYREAVIRGCADCREKAVASLVARKHE
ncbi:MAG: methyltransferase domain-containing protein [candidate division KSB1 bacterium]|nr:methyltransferase domain-containing protein [candidate division KSB1 bacterium]MDZ7273812.1 methyltransferase domain-containing protein [candidate division KSB1 bacterium]MDZ7285968.1 methyltransferase domain-containing protein [candidate division KSB1 bacterium]MDZ7299000.1 methyltransferase domain-containing protein [candidate division KSB1 bacterium]MDZ7309384.1 methyltransferase domain-containing protein [candidate division KSB1 bacterium]